MAGAYQLALSRATVEVQNPHGDVQLTHQRVTVSIRDGIARIREGAGQLAEMAVADLGMTKLGRNHYRIVGADGTVWDVSKPCGCGGA